MEINFLILLKKIKKNFPQKNEDAIEVASRENSVIKMEEKVSQYENLTGENLIMATMAQAAFMKESF